MTTSKNRTDLLIMQLQKIATEAKPSIQNVATIHILLHEIKPKYFGKDSVFLTANKEVKTGDIETKKKLGKAIQLFRSSITNFITLKLKELENIEIEERLKNSSIDGTISIPEHSVGYFHPITHIKNLVIKIFQKYGCQLAEGSEIETNWYNFNALNIPNHHPARQNHDTLYLKGRDDKNDNHLLRTHATAVDIRKLLQSGAPLRAIACGKVFRKDLDKTHTPMFHQCDMVMVDKGLNLGHLKSLLISFLEEFFETKDISIRMRPSYFPFTEPSVEIDIQYLEDKEGNIVPSKNGDKFLEILGCGMLSPIVLNNCKIDSNQYTGIAAGIGIERLAMLKYGFQDIRNFFKSDLKWLGKSYNKIVLRNN